jgi:hypothetical protein
MKFYSKLQHYYLSKFYLIFPAAMIVLACTGAFVTYFVTQNKMSPLNFIILFLSVLGAMTYLAAILSQAPRKTTFTLFVFGFILEILLLIWVMIF